MTLRSPYFLRIPFNSFLDADEDLEMFNAFRRSFFNENRGLNNGHDGSAKQPAGAEKYSNEVAAHPTKPSLFSPMPELAPLLSTELVESEKEFNIHVDLPGVQAQDVEVTIVDKSLVIKAERKHVHEENTDKVHSMERHYGKVQRRVRLPVNADVEGAVTKFKQGVLTITLPKKDLPANVRKLQINVEEK